MFRGYEDFLPVESVPIATFHRFDFAVLHYLFNSYTVNVTPQLVRIRKVVTVRIRRNANNRVMMGKAFIDYFDRAYNCFQYEFNYF